MPATNGAKVRTDGHETGQHDGHAAVLGEERLRALHLAVLDEPAVAVEGLGPDVPADVVVGRISQHRRRHQEQKDFANAQRTARRRRRRPHRERQSPGRRRDHESGLAKDDAEQDQVGPRNQPPTGSDACPGA